MQGRLKRKEDIMFIFIINPSSGNGKSTTFWRSLEKKLHTENVPFKKLVSTSTHETRQFVSHALKTHQVRAVGVIGGDGTISSVIQELANTSIPLAIFPAGSGNDTARMFNLTNCPEQFIQGILHGKTTCVDLLQLNDRFGITVAGVGIDTTIEEKVKHASYLPFFNKLGLVSLAYLIASIGTALTFKPFNAKITIDHQKQFVPHAWLIVCGNTTSYGGGLKICPDANPADGQFNLTMFHGINRFKAMTRVFPALLSGKPIRKNGITYAVGKELTISTDRPIPVIFDGEIIQAMPLHIKIQPHALQLLITT